MPSYSSESLVGRRLWVNLAHLSGDLKDHSIRIRFEIKNIAGEKAETEVIGYDLLGTYIKRIVRPNKDRIDDSFIASSQDNIKLRVKMIYLTRCKVNNSVSRDIMKKGREEIIGIFGKTSYMDVIGEIINNRLQKGLKGVLNKIYPLSNVDVKAIERLS